MKILNIGDVHGRNDWKRAIFGSVQEYDTWRSAVDSGLDAATIPYDKVIFVGDYVDSFDLTNVEILHNLNEIIHLKMTLGDKVVLLWGNHDIQYFVNDQSCSGFRSNMKMDLYDIFTKNESLFKLAHQEVVDDRNYLWTHGGVTSGWLSFFENKFLNNTEHRLYDIIEPYKTLKLADQLNLAWEMRFYGLFYVDYTSGGYHPWAGPLWNRVTSLNNYPLHKFTQVVGHTQQPEIRKTKVKRGSIHYFIDVPGDIGLVLAI